MRDAVSGSMGDAPFLDRGQGLRLVIERGWHRGNPGSGSMGKFAREAVMSARDNASSAVAAFDFNMQPVRSAADANAVRLEFSNDINRPSTDGSRTEVFGTEPACGRTMRA